MVRGLGCIGTLWGVILLYSQDCKLTLPCSRRSCVPSALLKAEGFLEVLSNLCKILQHILWTFVHMERATLAKVSGTDASKSRYREFSSGILDSVQRELLMMRLVPWLSLKAPAGD